ncbi:MAG: C1 family peptidase [Saprospiraceae bacterium]
MKISPYILLAAMLILSTISCTKDSDCTISAPSPSDDTFITGWNAENEQSDSVQVFLNGFGDCNGLPSSVLLSSKFPPVGNQGAYGTCVAWAAGYNMKTALEASNRGLSPADLSQPNNQLSPKDLFYSIPDGLKGNPVDGNCFGTQFIYALDILLNRGVATYQTVPYNGLGDCSQYNVQTNWTNEASQHKIKYYRRIDQDLCSIKEQLAANNPVLFGAKVGSNFSNLRGEQVFAQPDIDGGGHAMVIAGYDDNRQAFRIVNSWGTGWGDNGYAWIDYNFFVSQFVLDGNLYIAVNENGNVEPPDVNPNGGGVDLAAWVFSDIPTSPPGAFENWREIVLNVYNIGDETAFSSKEFEFTYLYYNAYDANDWDALFYDYISDANPPGTWDCFNGSCDFNINLPPNGGNLAQIVWGTQGTLPRSYTVPSDLNGYYYLVFFVDFWDDYPNEPDEYNNLFFTTWQSPKLFINGYSNFNGDAIEDRSADTYQGWSFNNEESPVIETLRQSKYNNPVNEKFKNAYRPEEIIAFFKKQKQNGALARKINAYKQRQASSKKPQYKKSN